MGKKQAGARKSIPSAVPPRGAATVPLRDRIIISPSILSAPQFAAIPAQECPVYLVPEEEGGFSATVATLPGCYSQGETEGEALANIIEALEGCLEVYRDREMPVPWRKPARRPAGAIRYTVLAHA